MIYNRLFFLWNKQEGTKLPNCYYKVSHYAYSFYTNERLTDIYAASTLRPLIAHQPIAYRTIASLMQSTM